MGEPLLRFFCATALSIALCGDTYAEEADQLPLSLSQQLDALIQCLDPKDAEKSSLCADEVQANAPNWQIHIESDLITDENQVTMARPFSGGKNAAEAKPSLVVACGQTGMFMMISGDFQISEERPLVTFRADKGEPFTSRWEKGQTPGSIFTREANQIYGLLGKDELIARFSTKNHGEITARFMVTDFDQAALWLKKHCRAYHPPA